MSMKERREAIAAAVAGSIWTKFQEDGTSREYSDWRSGVALEAVRIADEILDITDPIPDTTTELKKALEYVYRWIESEFRETNPSSGEYIEKSARDTWEVVCRALSL